MKATYQFFRGEVRAALPLFGLIAVLLTCLRVVSSLVEVRFGAGVFVSLALVALSAHAASLSPVAAHAAVLAARRWHRGLARILLYFLGLGLVAGCSVAFAGSSGGAPVARFEIGLWTTVCPTAVAAGVGYTMRRPLLGLITGVLSWCACAASVSQEPSAADIFFGVEIHACLLLLVSCLLWRAAQEEAARLSQPRRAAAILALLLCAIGALRVAATIPVWVNALHVT